MRDPGALQVFHVARVELGERGVPRMAPVTANGEPLLASRLAQDGLIVDRETANLAVRRRWLRAVANARVHATTGEIPAERLAIERVQLQPVPIPYGGRSVRSIQAKPAPAPIIGLQHPLSLYDAFAGRAA